MAKSGKCDCGEKGAPAWVVTYGDLMSLLLTFFVLLLSFASMDEPEEMQAAMVAIRGAFGIMPENKTLVPFNLQPQAAKALWGRIHAEAPRSGWGFDVGPWKFGPEIAEEVAAGRLGASEGNGEVDGG